MRSFEFTQRAPLGGAASLRVHTWIVFKEQGAQRYIRYDYTAWGEPIRTNEFAPDGRWFGAAPETIVAVDGDNANRLIIV
jgi:hypothetical protein